MSVLDSQRYFKILGQSYDNHFNFFILKTGRLRSLTSREVMSAPLLFELCTDANFWSLLCKEFESDKIDYTIIGTELIRRSQEIHFIESNIRPSGFWNDNERLVYNTGNRKIFEIIEDKNGFSQCIKHDFLDFKTNYTYVCSDKIYPEFDFDHCAKQIDGEKLEELFLAQEFESSFEAKYCIGWSLIAPFGTLLYRRPHMWVHGPSGKGKSHLIQEIIEPLNKDFALSEGSGSSFASIRRKLGSSGGFAILDEMEATNKKTRENIDNILEMIKNATSNTSGIAELVINNKIERFNVCQMFCLVSIVPNLKGQALESRFELVSLKNNINMNEKKKREKELRADGFFDDKSKFFNRTFVMLHMIFKSRKIIHQKISMELNSPRIADNVSTCLASYWHLKGNEVIKNHEANFLVSEYLEHIKNREKKEDDYEIFFRILFTHIVDLGMGIKKSITDMLFDYSNNENNLKMFGIAIKKGSLKIENDVLEASGYLSIHVKNQNIIDIMRKNETYFSDNYRNVLTHHPAYIEIKDGVRIGKELFRSAIFDIKKIAEKHFMSGEIILKDSEVPF